MAKRKLIIEVVADADKLKRGLKNAEGSLAGFQRRAEGRARKLPGGGLILGGVGKAGLIGAGIAAGAAVATKALSTVVAKAEEAQIAQANLSQAFAATGISAAKNGKKVEAAIQKVSKRAAIDDEEVSASFANLLRTTGSVDKATRDAALAADIARGRRISLAAATKIVEKAENGQLRGLKAVGVQIDKNTTSTQAIERAQAKFAGSADRYGRTAAGAQDKYRVALENVEERIGAKLLPLQTKLALAAVRFLDWSDRNWPRFARAIERTWNIAKPVVDAIVGSVKGIANVIIGVVKTIDAIAHGDWSKAWKGFKQVAVDGIGGILKSITSLPLKIAESLGKAALTQMERVFFAAMNKLIDIVNKAIGAYNVIPGVPDIPKIGHLGGDVKVRSSVGSARPDEGTRGVRPQQVVVQSDIYIDGQKVTRSVSNHQRASARRNPSQRRGPNAGVIVY